MDRAHRLSLALPAVAVAVLVVLLYRSLLHSGTRGADFWAHYWYVWHQAESLKDGGPSLFLHDKLAVFVPRFAFYGGTLYVLTGALGLLLGSVYTAYVATYFLAALAAYGGWWWLGRLAGLSRIAAHAPALVSATAAYSVTLVVIRGGWAELMALSALPVLAASALSILLADRLRLAPTLALALSAIVFTGSHALTFAGGTILLAVIAMALVAVVPAARALVSLRGLLRVMGVLVPAVLVNAWFLLPDVVYQSQTWMAEQKSLWEQYLGQFGYLAAPGRIFSLGRDAHDPLNMAWGLYALPVLVMAWAVAVAVAGRFDLRQAWLRVLAVLGVVVTLLILVMTHASALRSVLAMIQFSIRIEAFILVAICGAVIAALVVLRDRPPVVRRLLGGVLLGVLALSVIQAVLQAGVPRDTTGSRDILERPPYYTPTGLTHYEDYVGAPTATVDESAMPRISFPVERIENGEVSVSVEGQPGQLFVSNLAILPALVDIEGARPFSATDNLFTVLELGPGDGQRTVVTVRAAQPPAVVIGRWLSYLGLAGLAVNLLALLRRTRRRHRVAPPQSTVAEREGALLPLG